MNPILLDLPDDVKQWPEWLERQLVGLRLRSLVDQLKLVVKPTKTVTLEEVCGPSLDDAIQRGLSALSESSLRRLLANPDLLLELQSKVFLEGSSYWDNVAREDSHIDAVAEQLTLIKQKIRDEAASSPAVNVLSPVGQATTSSHAHAAQATDNNPSKVDLAPAVLRLNRRVWIAVGAIAASLLLLVSWRVMSPGTPGWGFARNDLATTSLQNAAYLDFLGARAGDWFNKTPSNESELDKRLSEFVMGCDALSRAPHKQLTNPLDRTWLVSRCNQWRGQLEQIRSSLRTKSRALSDLQIEANEVIRGIQKELGDKASGFAFNSRNPTSERGAVS